MINLTNMNSLCISITSLFGMILVLININYLTRSDLSPKYLPPKIKSLTSKNYSFSPVKEFLKESERIWENSVGKRHAIVRSKGVKRINPWFDHDLIIWWDYFYPSFNCPHHLERIGRVGDGGKWVCGFSLFENRNRNKNLSCVVYSFGVAEESSFEQEILQRSDCHIWAYDPSVESMPKSLSKDERIQFTKMGIRDTNTQHAFGTLGYFMRQNGHEWIDILKVDVEGWEFRVFNQIMEEFQILPFGQLLLEIHADNFKNFKVFYEWWEQLESKGLRAIFLEQNNYMYNVLKRPVLMEYVFLNVKANHLVVQ